MLIKPFFPFVSGLADQMDILQHRSPCKQFFDALRVRDESWRVAWASLGFNNYENYVTHFFDGIKDIPAPYFYG